MKNIGLILITLILCTNVFAQVSQNMNLLGHWDNDTLDMANFFNDIWGYAADDREYAIMGSRTHIHVFDVTDPSDIVLIDTIAGGANTTWRDFKTYRDRAYCVADNSGEGLIILDLSDLPSTVDTISQVDTVFTSSHNCFIDETNGRLYIVGGDISGNILIYDIATDPDNPAVLGVHDLPGGYIHDLYVRDHIVYASSAYDGFYIYDMTDVDSIQTIAFKETNGYNHSNWVSEDGTYAIFAEEVPAGLPLGVMDLSEMMDNNLADTYFQEMLIQVDSGETRNTPHNPYLLGDLMITSYYEDGVHVYDMRDPFNPTLEGYYDTHPSNETYNGYNGCWGVYPFLPSGNILASDRGNGLFVLEFAYPVGTNDLPQDISSFKIYPNPTSNDFTIEIESDKAMDFDYQLRSITGQLVGEGQFKVNGEHSEQIETHQLLSGIYLLTLQNGAEQFTKKVSVIK